MSNKKDINYVKANKESLFLLVIEICLAILGTLTLLDDVLFLTTKKETYAKVIKLEKIKSLNPYRITFSYFNEYENKVVISKINDIEGIYGKTLINATQISIYYRRYFPNESYLVDYEHPNVGTVTLLIIFLLIMSLAIYFSAKKLTSNNVR